MTEVKGSALIPMQMFIKNTFGDDNYELWLNSLSNDARPIFSYRISSNSWYPLNHFLTEPTKNCCDLFYGGDVRGAWEIGKYSGEYSLSVFYKPFTEIGNIDFIIKKLPKIISTYYRPCETKVEEYAEGWLKLIIVNFPGLNIYVENRIAGWLEKAFEIHNCCEISVSIANSSSSCDGIPEIDISWK